MTRAEPLHDLLRRAGWTGSVPDSNPLIHGIRADSRAIGPGMLFAALPGNQQHGEQFVPAALAAGAVCILSDRPITAPKNVAQLITPEARAWLARFAAALAGPQPRRLVAVTGTNGKTSVTHFLRQLWHAKGWQAACLGTTGLWVADQLEQPGQLTTPDPVTLHRLLADLAARNIQHVALEASSHGLHQQRLAGAQVAVACFTNLTRDHLDYHGTMAAYAAAKGLLFAEVLAANGTAVLYGDDPASAAYAAICRARGQRVLSFGTTATSVVQLQEQRPTPTGQHLRGHIAGQPFAITLPLLGRFQALNVLAAWGCLLAGEETVQPDQASQMRPVPGRMELVGTCSGGAVYVDYAHTPDALAQVLRAARDHASGRVRIVFGAGGNRDAGKRPQMGVVAAQLADDIIITDDNPRHEDPAVIRAAIAAACPAARIIADRAAAIAAAIESLQSGDVLIIAGKGHETGQQLGDMVSPFDDRIVARSLLAAAAA